MAWLKRGTQHNADNLDAVSGEISRHTEAIGAVSDQGHALPMQVINTTVRALDASLFAGMGFDQAPPALVLAFVSPHVDFNTVSHKLRALLPTDTRLLLTTTAGEISSNRPGSSYHGADDAWDNVVLQIFAKNLIADVSVHWVPLHSEDIRSGVLTVSANKRVEAIRQELNTIRPAFDLDVHDTVALTFVDGLSASESSLMEAVYSSAKFPVLFIGGSA